MSLAVPCYVFVESAGTYLTFNFYLESCRIVPDQSCHRIATLVNNNGGKYINAILVQSTRVHRSFYF